MIVGELTGKGDLFHHEFKVKTGSDITLDSFVTVEHYDTGIVLCRITNMKLAKGDVIGILKPMIRIPNPFMKGMAVQVANPEQIMEILDIGKKAGRIHLGKIRGHDIEVYLDVNAFIEHGNVIGRTGRGKTYTASVIIEAVAKLGITSVVFDKKGDFRMLHETFPDKTNYIDLESTGKWTLEYSEMYDAGKITIINLARLSKSNMEGSVKLMLWHLWENRSPERPILTFVDEAHNFSPQKGKPVCAEYMDTIAIEGRGEGIGMIRLTQRPAKLNKNCFSQAEVHITLGMTEKNDLNVVESIPGLTRQDKPLIQDLRKGEAVIVGGNIPCPLVVKIKKRDSPDKPNVKFIEV